jgi:hypothetical protein
MSVPSKSTTNGGGLVCGVFGAGGMRWYPESAAKLEEADECDKLDRIGGHRQERVQSGFFCSSRGNEAQMFLKIIIQSLLTSAAASLTGCQQRPRPTEIHRHGLGFD